MMRWIAKRYGFFPNEAFFGRQKRTWATCGPSTTYPHAQEENRLTVQSTGSPLNTSWIRCRWPPQDRWSPPGHPQGTPPASCCRLPIRRHSSRFAYSGLVVRLALYPPKWSHGPAVWRFPGGVSGSLCRSWFVEFCANIRFCGCEPLSLLLACWAGAHLGM